MFRILDDVPTEMNTNRKRQRVSQQGIRVPRIGGRDTMVSVEAVVVNDCDPKLSPVTRRRYRSTSQRYWTKALGQYA
jgi:hypothetical protein